MHCTIFHKFPAREYATRYYSYVGHENAAMLVSIVDGVRRLAPRLDRVAEVGGGPSVAPLLALTAASRAPEDIVFIDIAASNLAEVRSWLDGDASAFDYAAVLKWLARRTEWPESAVEKRLRAAHWRIRELDLTNELPRELPGGFDTVSSHFFAESATQREDQFVDFLRQIRCLCAPKAVVLLSFMRRSLGYSVGGEHFPAVQVDETSLPGHFAEAGLELEFARWSAVGAEDPPTRDGYEGMVFVSGQVRS